MDLPFSRWNSAITARRSRRKYSPEQIDADILEQVRRFCKEFRPFQEARAVLVTETPDRVFKGAIGHYGKIKGAPAFIAFIGNMDDPNIQEKVGYSGEGVILEATAKGLATCWVGGFFRPEIASLLAGARQNETVLAVTPIGYVGEDLSLEDKIMAGFGRNHRRKPLSELVTGLEEIKWAAWIREALYAARLAPSAVNRQPWRFHVEQDSITVLVDNPKDTFNISKRLDCGIAMLHIEVAALQRDIKGEWEFLESPGVARFRVIKEALSN